MSMTSKICNFNIQKIINMYIILIFEGKYK